jgi:hypothetical protein
MTPYMVTMPRPLCLLAVTGNVDYGVDDRTGRDGNQVRGMERAAEAGCPATKSSRTGQCASPD